MKSTHSQVLKLAAVVAGVLAFSFITQAQTQPSKAEVRAVKGTGHLYCGGGACATLESRHHSPCGSVVKTSAGSMVDLFLGNSAGLFG
jgi:hypothetical protein